MSECRRKLEGKEYYLSITSAYSRASSRFWPSGSAPVKEHETMREKQEESEGKESHEGKYQNKSETVT